jgi:hypothetical protein
MSVSAGGVTTLLIIIYPAHLLIVTLQIMFISIQSVNFAFHLSLVDSAEENSVS